MSLTMPGPAQVAAPPASALDAIEVTVFSRFEDAEAIWREAGRSAHGYPFQHFDWLSRWYEEFDGAARFTPQIVLVSDRDGRPLLLLPLAVQRSQGLRVLVWMGREVNSYQAPLVLPAGVEWLTPGRFEVLWGRVRRSVLSHSAVHLERQPERIGALPNPFITLGGVAFVEGESHQARLTSGWDAYYAAHTSKRRRKDLARRARRLAEHGEERFVLAREPDEALRVTELMMEQKSRRFIETRAPDLFARADYRRFYSRMATECAGSDLMHVSALECNGEQVATHWALVADGWMTALWSGFELGEWERLSVGTRLQEHVVRWCFDHQVDVYDFMIGDEPYKQEWCDEEMRVFEHFAPASWPGRAYTSPRVAHRRLKRAAMQVAPLARVSRAAKRAVRARLSGGHPEGE